MALTFPIDTVDIYEIKELAHILDEFPGDDDILRYVCYRFDPKCTQVRDRKTVAEKDAVAATLAGYSPEREKKTIVTQMSTHVLRQLNSLDWEVMCSLEIAFDEAMQIIREEIVSGDRDEMLKAVDLKQKVISGMGKTEDLLLTRQQKIAAADELAMKVITETTGDRKKRRNTLTGQMEEVSDD